MVPMSYHSCREKLGNYLQIKVMLSDSSAQNTARLFLILIEGGRFLKSRIKSKAEKRCVIWQSSMENKLIGDFFNLLLGNSVTEKDKKRTTSIIKFYTLYT